MKQKKNLRENGFSRLDFALHHTEAFSGNLMQLLIQYMSIAEKSRLKTTSDFLKVLIMAVGFTEKKVAYIWECHFRHTGKVMSPS